MLIVLITTFIITLLYLWNLLNNRSNEPPALPGALPFIGHAHYMLGSSKNLWESCLKLTEKSINVGHPFYIKLGNIKVYVVSDPDDCYTVAQNCLEKPFRMYEFTKNLLGVGIICSKKDIWNRHRRLMNPMFNQRVLDGFIEIFNSNAKSLVTDLCAVVGKGFFDPLLAMQKNAIRNTFSTLTGQVQCDINRLEKILNALNTSKEIVINRLQKIWLYYDIIYNWTNLKQMQDSAVKILRGEARTLYYKTKRSLSESLTSKTCNGNKIASFLEFLVQLENNGLSESEIIDEINTIMLGSYDTSFALLTYALVCIGSYPHVQERLYQEIKENILYDDKNGYEINKFNLSKLNYLDAVIKEIIRTENIIPIVPRHIDKDIKLKNYTLYEGNECILLLNVLNKHPLWGKDAQEFKPERWLNPNTLPKNSNVYAGFGLGRRNCIGKLYAMIHSKVVLAHVVMNYKILGDHTKMVHKYQFLLEPVSGHHISIVRRQGI